MSDHNKGKRDVISDPKFPRTRYKLQILQPDGWADVETVVDGASYGKQDYHSEASALNDCEERFGKGTYRAVLWDHPADTKQFLPGVIDGFANFAFESPPRQPDAPKLSSIKSLKLSDLYKSYTEDELQNSEGDSAIRFRAFSPFFQNLHEGKVIYYEKFMCIARLDDLKISSERISATAVCITPIDRGPRYRTPQKPWNIGMQWSWMTLCSGGLGNPYVGWRVWPEAERVHTVEKLIASGDIEGIMKLTLYSEEDEE